MAFIRCCRVEEMPDPFRELAWQVFFARRGRGVSLDAHFPWLRGGGRDDMSWLLEVDTQPAAMLVVRRGVIDGVAFHAIGLVCTAPAFKRRGFATRLLRATLAAIGDDAPVLLWTSQHGFYERLGFALLDCSVVATCTFPMSAAAARGAPWQQHDWSAEDRASPCFGGQRGLPTFVTAAERRHPAGDPAVSLVLSDGTPPIVLDLTAGVTPALLASIGSARLVLNLPHPTPLLAQLRDAGIKVDVRNTGLAMWRLGQIARDVIKQWDISLLDRF